MKTFDVAIIGGGQTGVPLSRALAEAGQKIVLFEDKHLGGSCVNFGCTPSKAIIASAHVAHQSRNAKEWGVDVGAVRVDFPAVMRRARRIVAQSKTSLDESFAHRRNPLLIAAKARLDGKRENLFVIKSAKQNVLAKHVVLNTGSRTAIPHIPGLKDVPYITGENWIGMKALPQKLIFIGGGYIALEMAQAFRRFGSEVVVLEAGDRLIEHEDADVAAAIREFLEAEGIKFILNAKIDRIVKRKGGVDVVLAGGKTVTGSHLFVATGREANTAYLGFDTIGVMRGKNGIVEVDSRSQTKTRNVWAAGDIRGGPQFTNTAYDDFVVIRDQLLGKGRKTTRRIVNYAIFTDPELGRVGMSEAEALAAGKDILIGRYDMKDSGKARELGKTTGFIKVIAERKTCRILGAAALCESGSEVVQLFTELMNAGATTNTMINALHIHPTLAEAAKNAVAKIDPR